jgi:hypothetical protein
VEDLVEVVLGRELESTLQQGVEPTVATLRHPHAPALINDMVSESVLALHMLAAAPRSVVDRCPVPYLHRMAPTRLAQIIRAQQETNGGAAMLMLWFLGHTTLIAFIVMLVGLLVLAALMMYRIALHAASYVEIAPVRVRPGRRGLS